MVSGGEFGIVFGVGWEGEGKGKAGGVRVQDWGMKRDLSQKTQMENITSLRLLAADVLRG